MLEEPPSGSLLVLVCGRPGALPATVRSRCQRWEIRSPEREQALTWLRAQLEPDGQEELFLGLAGGAPLLALAMARSDKNSDNCLLIAAGTHPDLHAIVPADEGKPITIDQIRALSESMTRIGQGSYHPLRPLHRRNLCLSRRRPRRLGGADCAAGVMGAR